MRWARAPYGDEVATFEPCLSAPPQRWNIHLSGQHLEDTVPGIDPQALMPFARKYIWWKTPQDAIRQPRRVVIQVMNIGDYDDVQDPGRLTGEGELGDILTHAEAGQFSARSWAYRHYRLKLARMPESEACLRCRGTG